MLRSCRLPTRDCRAAPARPALRRLPKEGRHSSPAKPPSSYSSPKPPSSSPPNPPPPSPPPLLLKHRLQTGSLSLGPFFGPKKFSNFDQYCKIYFAGYIGKRQRDIRAKANTPPMSPNVPNIPPLHAPDNLENCKCEKHSAVLRSQGKCGSNSKLPSCPPKMGFLSSFIAGCDKILKEPNFTFHIYVEHHDYQNTTS